MAQSEIRNRKSEILSVVLPILYLAHLLEEYFTGFPAWISEAFDADLSNADFLWLNGVFLLVVIINATMFVRGHGRSLLLTMFWTVFSLNGVLHILASLYWGEYVPGLVTGVIFYLPLGFFGYQTVMSKLPNGICRRGVVLGVVVHALVFIVARNI